MAVKKPLCSYSGIKQELQSADAVSMQNVPCAITFELNGNGSAITTALVSNILRATFGMTINKWEIDSVESGSIVLDVLKNGSSIVASAPPTLSAATNAESTSLTGWTTSVAVEDKITIEVDSATTVQRCTLTLYGVRT